MSSLVRADHVATRTAAAGQLAEASGHLHESVIRLKKPPRRRIDKGDATGHVRENIFVKNNFPLDATTSFGMALEEIACAPRDHSGRDKQPADKIIHLDQQIVHWLIRDGFWLLHHCHPAGGLDWIERIKLALELEMPALTLTDLIDQQLAGRKSRAQIRLKIFIEKRRSLLVIYFAQGLIGKLNGR